jgi:WD40 repeat protein
MPQLQLVADLPGHPSPAWQIAFNPSRPLLASCSTDKTFRLYSYTRPSNSQPSLSTFPSSDSPRPAFSFLQSVTTEHKKSVRSIAWAPSGKTLATGSFDSTVGIWEETEDEGDVREGIVRSKKPVIKENEDERDETDSEGLGEGKEWECVTTLEGHDSECKSVGFSSDGALLGSCSRDKSVWVWEGALTV